MSTDNKKVETPYKEVTGEYSLGGKLVARVSKSKTDWRLEIVEPRSLRAWTETGISQESDCDDLMKVFAEAFKLGNDLTHLWEKYDNSKPMKEEYFYGFHPDWINADSNPDGVREIVYEGDHYVSSYWCMSCDEWHSTSTGIEDNPVKPLQPLYVIKSFPVKPPSS